MYITELAQGTDGFSYAQIKAFMYKAIVLHKTYKPAESVDRITKEYLNLALTEVKKEELKFWNYETRITDEERRHQELLKQSREQFEQNQELQKKITEGNMILYASIEGYKKKFDPSQDAWSTSDANTLGYLGHRAIRLIFPDRPAVVIPPQESTSCSIM